MKEPSGLTKVIVSILFFPYFFQNQVMAFAWGAEDDFFIMLAKRFFLLLPLGAVIIALWASIIGLVTVIFRQNRVEFVNAIVITWWDLGRSILSFWGGLFKFVFTFIAGIFGLLKVLLVGTWFIIEDIFSVPFRVLRSIAGNVLAPGVPWIAVALTLFWCFIEAVIFTYVMTPLVVDTLSNMTGDQLTEGFIRIPLFLFMLFLILGSYAVLSTWATTIKQRDIGGIIKIGIIEFVALSVEVMFLYREFVDSLVPWFAQHASDGFELGITGTLFIAFMAWLGVRGMSWFLFAAHGTPTIMAVIQGAGVQTRGSAAKSKEVHAFDYTMRVVGQIKVEMDWIQKKGDEILSSFILPPLQVVAASVNFCTLLISTQHLFDLPFKSVAEIMSSKELLRNLKK